MNVVITNKNIVASDLNSARGQDVSDGDRAVQIADELESTHEKFKTGHEVMSGIMSKHMGAEPQNSFEEVPRDPLYGKLTTRHHRLGDYVSPNQTCKVFGDFGQKS